VEDDKGQCDDALVGVFGVDEADEGDAERGRLGGHHVDERHGGGAVQREDTGNAGQSGKVEEQQAGTPAQGASPSHSVWSSSSSSSAAAPPPPSASSSSPSPYHIARKLRRSMRMMATICPPGICWLCFEKVLENIRQMIRMIMRLPILFRFTFFFTAVTAATQQRLRTKIVSIPDDGDVADEFR
jgi:hypothetical protein